MRRIGFIHQMENEALRYGNLVNTHKNKKDKTKIVKTITNYVNNLTFYIDKYLTSGYNKPIERDLKEI